jgi:single-strand DNA-binding protein
MNGTTITVIGCAATTINYGTTNAGVPYAYFRLAASERRYDRERQCWVDGESSFFTVWAFRWMAENLVSSVSKGDPLVVTGRMRVREWQRDERQPRTAVAEIEAVAIGHDLSRGTSAFRRAVRARPELTAPAAERDRAAREDGGRDGAARGRDAGRENATEEKAAAGMSPGPKAVPAAPRQPLAAVGPRAGPGAAPKCGTMEG